MKWQMTGDQSFTLSSLKGSRSVIYFYPKDSTPGCTKEGQDFAKNFKTFQKLGVKVFGVSRDSISSHEKFKEKFQFPFDLVSDPDEELCKKFDVIREKKLYGRKFMGVERSTFVLDEKGKVEKEWRGVKVPDHVAEVLAYLKGEE